jgi:protein SCO1/2
MPEQDGFGGGRTPAPATTPKRAALRSPFFWVAIGGLILIPFIRPLTRRVPPAPAVIGRMPPFELTDQEHRAFGDRNLVDRVYLASFLDASCRQLCNDRVSALVKLDRRCRRMGVKLWLVTISIDPEVVPIPRLRDLILQLGGTLDRWILLSGAGVAARRFRDQGLQPLADAARADGVRQSLLRGQFSLLVDGDGNVRGAYPTNADGLYEGFHRAQHVMSLREAWR